MRKILLSVLFVICLSTAFAQPVVIAHRGASWDAPENTLAAFNLAWEQGIMINELDIFLSKDGHVVVFHDKTTERFNGKDDKIEDLTLEELKQIDVGSHLDPKWKNERIPTLEEVIETVPPGRQLLIEIKVGTEIVYPLKEILENSHLDDSQIIIMSFSSRVVRKVRSVMPQYEVHRLLGAPRLSGRISGARMRRHGISTLSVRHKLLFRVGERFVRDMQRAGMQVYVWTVNCPEDAIRLQEIGVDGIITDRPALIREELERARNKHEAQKKFDKLHQISK